MDIQRELREKQKMVQHLRNLIWYLERATVSNQNDRINLTSIETCKLAIAVCETKQQLIHWFLKTNWKLTTESGTRYIRQMRAEIDNVVNKYLSDTDIRNICNDPIMSTMCLNARIRNHVLHPVCPPNIQLEALVQNMMLQQYLVDMTTRQGNLGVNCQKKKFTNPNSAQIYGDPGLTLQISKQKCIKRSLEIEGLLLPICLSKKSCNAEKNDKNQLGPLCLVKSIDLTKEANANNSRKRTLGGEQPKKENVVVVSSVETNKCAIRQSKRKRLIPKKSCNVSLLKMKQNQNQSDLVQQPCDCTYKICDPLIASTSTRNKQKKHVSVQKPMSSEMVSLIQASYDDVSSETDS